MRWDDGLLERLLALDAEAVALRGELARHQTAHDPCRDDVVRHDWPLADDPARPPGTLGVYDRRPDDPAIVAARDGAEFLATLGAKPSAEALRRIRPSALSQAPQVSVVIPVHGQLACTLNCLHGLLGHRSRWPFEVIVVDDASPDETACVVGGLAAGVPGLSLLRRPRNEGFVAACNAGAAAAAGAFVVLLNNDTRVAAGWLDALIDSFGLFPRAGLVGSKLLYPDGRLQEAGAIVWRDGSAWNYGRGDDPNRPEYCHARQVDYVSGASIALPASLWRQLGGFDAAFAPGYCEDADLAFRVRAAGHEVWFQPASRVVHYEGRTGGTDTGTGAKAHQVGNLKKLFVRWHRALAGHGRPGSDPYLESQRGVVRRALVVDATAPTPKQDAGSGVTVASIRLLQALGYKVHFVPQDNFLFQVEHTGALQQMGVECGYSPFDTGFDAYLSRHGAAFDVVMVFRPGVFASVEAALGRHAPQAAVVFSNADLHFLRLERQAALSGEAVPGAAMARAEELALIARAPVTMTLSTFERDVLAREAPGACVVLQPFPSPVAGTQAGFAARRDFLFLGGYGHSPNIDAAVYFVRDIWPLIRAMLPDARAIIAGANPTAEVLALAAEDVEVVGPVDDLAPLFDRARVFVCPLRVGAGVKGKVIAAMAHGLPVVATSCGAEGIEADLIVADGPPAFAAACVRLYRDAELWRRQSQAGLKHVEGACSAAAGELALSAAIDAAHGRRLFGPGVGSPRSASEPEAHESVWRQRPAELNFERVNPYPVWHSDHSSTDDEQMPGYENDTAENKPGAAECARQSRIP